MSEDVTDWDEMPFFGAFMNTMCGGDEELKAFLQVLLGSGDGASRPSYAAPGGDNRTYGNLLLWGRGTAGKTTFRRLLAEVGCGGAMLRESNQPPTHDTVRTDMSPVVYAVEVAGTVAADERHRGTLYGLLAERRQVLAWLREGRLTYEREGLHVPERVQVFHRRDQEQP